MEHEFDADHAFDDVPHHEGEEHPFLPTNHDDSPFGDPGETANDAGWNTEHVPQPDGVQVEDEHHDEPSTGEGPQARGDKHGAQLLEFIVEIEKGLSQLREASIEQASMFEAAESVRQRIEKERTEIDAQRHEIERQRTNLATKECELESRWAELEQQQTSLDERIADLDRRQHEIEQVESKLGERHADIEEQAQQLRQEWDQLNEARSKLDADLHEFSEAQSRLDAQREELDQRQHQLNEHQANLDQQREELETFKQSLEAQRQEIEEQRAGLEERVQAISNEEARLSELRSSTGETEQHFADRESAIVERELELDRREKDLEARLESVSVPQPAKHVDHGGELQQLRTMLAERTGEIESLRRELNEARAAAAQNTDTADGKGATADAAAARVNELEAELEDREKAIETLTGHFKTLKSQFENARQTLLERNREIDRLRGELENLEAGANSGEAAVPPTPVVVEGIDQQFLITRRERLRRQRQLLKERIARLAEIKKQIDRRAEATKDIASQQELFKSVQEDLARAEAKMIRKWAHSATVTRLFMFVMTLAILAGGSYFGVVRFVPATYQAKSTVTAQARPGFPLTPEQAQTWQLVNEELAKGDQVAKAAAERFAQQGITELSTPEAVQEYVAANLIVQSNEPGSIEFILMGEGQHRALRLLETYSIAFVSASNSSRGKRTDGARAKLTVPATIDPIPVKDDRLNYAAIAFGGSIFLLLPIGMVIYGRLKKAERVFDPSGDLFEPMVDDAKWGDIRDHADGVVSEHVIR